MKKLSCITILLIAAVLPTYTQKAFPQKTIREIRKDFILPSPEYGMILWWGWDGPVNDTVIWRDLDRIKSMGFRGVMIEAGYGMTAKYLSPEWFSLIRTSVIAAKRRGMTVWIEDEGKYPSGFAGGKFSQERPDLKMQGLVVLDRIDIKKGEPFFYKLKPGTLSAVAVNLSDNSIKIQDISSGEINWPADPGEWRLITAGNRYRSSVTRSVNNPSRGKDTTASLMDYLNPAATQQFLSWTHEQYKKYIGEEFGKTFRGFMGDEPDFAYTPWTPAITGEFLKKKGYDIRPYLAAFFAPVLIDDVKRAKADYWDVWSDMFRDNFFKVQADWCRENNIEYIVHLNHEDQLPGLVKSSGDFFKNMRYVGSPGVDAIWNQIWMDHVADYPKLASSAAHLYGMPRAFTESFAAYTYRPTIAQAKWVLDYQLVRGINSVQIMFMSASATRSRSAVMPNAQAAVQRTSFFMSDTFPGVASYINRASYLLSQGRPACKTGLYIPTQSMWLSDNQANANLLTAAQKLLENQADFDFIDEQALSGDLTFERGKFMNISGQEYNTVIVPSCSIMSKASMDRLKEFAAGGGKVVFAGGLPTLLWEGNILSAVKCPDQPWADVKGELSSGLIEQLPERDFILSESDKLIKYLHRNLIDGELYFIFNESSSVKHLNFILPYSGNTEEWDAMTGKIKRIRPIIKGKNAVTISAEMMPWETKFFIVSR